MNVYIKAFNSCVMRKQKLVQYQCFMEANGHKIAVSPEMADVSLIWTCGFRGDFRDGSIHAVGELLKQSRGKVLVAGCLPDIDSGALPVNDRVVLVPWKQDSGIMESFFGSESILETFSIVFCEPQRCADTAVHRQEFPDDDCTFHDQFIKLVISEGCLFNCSYCSEKMAFPPFRSFPVEDLVRRCRTMIGETGVYDIILMADSLGQYGADIKSSLPVLMDALCNLDSRVTLALNNLNPANFIEFMDDMKRFIGGGRISHLNLPIQSASSRMLKSMNRPYTRENLEMVYGLLSDMGFTAHDTHVLVGFPGEAWFDIDETLAFVEQIRPRYALVSIYMESPGSPSASLYPKIPPHEALERVYSIQGRLKGMGIICNADGSELSQFRLERLAAKL